MKSSILLAGEKLYSQKKNDVVVDGWILNDKTGNISFHQGSKILVQRSGYYYAYSQMYYDGVDSARRDIIGRTTYLHDTMIMKSWGNWGNTTYHGGVFHLEKFDILTVKIPKNGTAVTLDGKGTFFGAFLLQADKM